MESLSLYADASILELAQEGNANPVTTVSSASEITPSALVDRLHAASNYNLPQTSAPPQVPYAVDAWEEALMDHPDPELIKYHLTGLRQGYEHGNHSRGDLRIEAITGNLRSATEFPEILTENITKELTASRYLGPFLSLEDLPADCRPFRNAPLGVVPKKHTNPPKFRTIQHFSFPPGASINDGIDPDEFSIQYEGAQKLIELLRASGPSSLFWKADVADAFRTIPIRRADWGMQGISWLGFLFIDMYCPFGLRSAPFIFTSLMDVFTWICRTKHSLPNLAHFVDDFIYVASPAAAEESFQSFKAVAARFGVPFQPSKFVGPAPIIEYVGFVFNAPTLTVSLPDDKRVRIRNLLISWLTPSRPKASYPPRSHEEAQSLLGHLIHVVQVFPDGKVFCDSLIRFIRSWQHPYRGKRHINKQLVDDLDWWITALESGITKQLSHGQWEDIGFYTDASGAIGVGAYLGSRWWCAKWSADLSNSNADGRDIFWKEMFAIWASLEAWAISLSGRRVILHCDSQPCVATLLAGRASGQPRVNELLRRIVLVRRAPV
jgi:hypothetical protein